MTENFAFNANRQTHRGVGIKQWRLVARNLPFATKKEELEEFFGNHGHVLEVVLPKCKDKRFPDSCAGFAFVQYASKGSAENAKKTANFSEFKGRKIAVDYAVDKDTYVTVTHPEKETIEKAERKVFKEEPDAKRKLKPKTKGNQKTTEKVSSLKIKEELSSDAEEEEDEEVRSETKEPPKKKFKDEGKTKKEPKDAVTQEPKEEQEPSKPEKRSDTATAEGRVVFIRNLSFDSTNEIIKDQMSRFGEVSLAIMCKYPSTDQPTGTAFVHFKEKEAADQCLDQLISEEGVSIDGRKIYGYRAVPRDQASAFKEKEKKPKDKRNLYLLRASLIRPGTAQARGMSDEDAEKRARLAEMARTKLKNLHMFVSPNRLAIHNIPFSMSVQELRSACMLATKNVDAEVTECRIMRNKKGEDTHGRPLLGKSKGFGFVAFKEHDDALRCLRNLNNNPETFTNDKVGRSEQFRFIL
ncbi:Protein RBM-28 [Aphelenchoides avenae]|nr:Protein RBM-28 [Aphelenchus avenae]